MDGFLDVGVSSVEKFQSFYCDLFIFNKNYSQWHRSRFSSVIEKLKCANPKDAATILNKAAEKVQDPRIYGQAARFNAKMSKPQFEKAKKLIATGLELASQSKRKSRSIQHSKGVVLLTELKYKIRRNKVKSIDELKILAENAITAFKTARDFPLSTHPPLIG